MAHPFFASALHPPGYLGSPFLRSLRVFNGRTFILFHNSTSALSYVPSTTSARRRCPISLAPLGELPYPPFVIKESHLQSIAAGEKTVEHSFDGAFLAQSRRVCLGCFRSRCLQGVSVV